MKENLEKGRKWDTKYLKKSLSEFRSHFFAQLHLLLPKLFSHLLWRKSQELEKKNWNPPAGWTPAVFHRALKIGIAFIAQYFMVLRGIVAYLKFYPMGFHPRKLGAWRCLNVSLIKEHHRPMRLYLSLTISRLDGWRTFPHFWTTFSRTSTRWK